MALVGMLATIQKIGKPGAEAGSAVAPMDDKNVTDERRLLLSLGKKLLGNNTNRWSLRDGADKNEVLEDMGVSLLDEPCNLDSDINDPRENIENFSPNAQNTLKRSHSKSNIWSSENKTSPLKEIESSSLKSFSPPKRVHLSPSNKLLNQENVNLSNSKFEKNVGCSNSLSSSKHSEDPNIAMKVSTVADHRILTNNVTSSSFRTVDSNDNDETKDIHSKKIIIESNEKLSNSILAQISPLTTCGPHPPFHQYSKSITRHTTFDEENDTIDAEKLMYLLSEESNNPSVSNKLETKIRYTNRERFSNENNIINDLLNTKSSNYEEKELLSTSDKECFVAQNVSVCDSCDKCKKSSCEDCNASKLEENQSGFSKLFDEIVLCIFQWLPKKTLVRCMLVSKRWHRLALDSRLWSRVCLGGRVLSSGVLPNLMNRHPIILRLANAQLISPVVPDSCTQWRVQFLDLSAASVEPECLAKILLCCRSLLRLSLEGLTFCESTAAALGHLTNLQVLNLALASNLGQIGAESITKMPKLIQLNIAWTRLNNEATKTLCEGLPLSLHRLNISGFRITLTEKLVQYIVARCPNLVELDLSDCVMMGDRLIPILQNLRSLEHLAISRCHRLKRTDFILLNEFPSLQYLDVFGLISPLTPITLNMLHSHLPKIKFNQFMHSAIARPTVGNRRTSIWGLRTRD